MNDFKNIRRFSRLALTALCVGAAVGAAGIGPMSSTAWAKNGDHGGGHGSDHGGGKGADHGNAGGNGNGNGNGNGGNAGGNGNDGDNDSDNGNGNGKGNANGHSDSASGNDQRGGQQGPSDNAGPGNADVDVASNTEAGDDDSLSPHGLGKLNGFFHASPRALAHASPHSAIGRISHVFAAALAEYAEAQEHQQPSDDGTSNDTPTPPTGPTAQDLGAILAGATNKPVTAAQVHALAARLAELHPDDAALADFAGKADEAKCQEIADAANAARAGTPISTDDNDNASGGDDGTTTTVTTTVTTTE